MSRKTSPLAAPLFMAAVAETGNQTIAAEHARVSRSWVRLHRSTDPAFRAELDAALATAKASFDKLGTNGGRMRPPSGWGSIAGEELVVRGGNWRHLQIARARLGQWTPRVEERFLRLLAATANVTAACAGVGLSTASAYAHYHRWPKFAAAWEAAIEDGYLFLESALLENAMNILDPAGFATDPAARPSEPMTIDQAVYLLKLHKQRAPRA